MSALHRRLVGLAEDFELPEGSAKRLRALLDAVEHDPAAPTTVTDPSAGVDVHVADSLDGLRIPELRAARRVADLGAGAGFPGLVLAVALPGAEVALLDAASKKAAFMARAATAIEAANARPLHARAEEWAEGMGRQEVVTARALAALPVLVEYAAPLLVLGGTLVAWKGRRDPAEEADGDAAAAATGMERTAVVVPPARPGADRRTLYVYTKAGPTPPRFPRRPGMARKRPLAASAGV